MSTRPAFGLKDRRVIITGAAQGIGLACAQALALEGARLALWDVDAAKLQTACAALTAMGAQAKPFTCDVSQAAAVNAAMAASLEWLGGVDGLVNNAGIFRAAEFIDITEADWDAVIGVNLKGAFLVAQAVARHMVHSGQGGAIVNMSSVNATLAISNIASYNVSKGGINQLTRVMSLGLADHRIRVNAVAPGTIATELAAKAVLGSPAAKERILGRTPLRRLGDPAEVASAVIFLLSDAASYITGEILTVDGGRMALNYTMPALPNV
jgi:NAD(P)-dependent dehydrogenase (short-subunit alcohol dehydrogenase family)